MQEEIGLIVLDSAEKMGRRIDRILSEWRGGGSFLIPAECPRFSSGEAKCVLRKSVRDLDAPQQYLWFWHAQLLASLYDW